LVQEIRALAQPLGAGSFGQNSFFLRWLFRVHCHFIMADRLNTLASVAEKLTRLASIAARFTLGDEAIIAPPVGSSVQGGA